MFETFDKGQHLYEQKFVFCGFHDKLSKQLISTVFKEQFFVLAIMSHPSGYSRDFTIGIDTHEGHGYATKELACKARNKARRQKTNGMYKSAIVTGIKVEDQLTKFKKYAKDKYDANFHSINLLYRDSF